MKKIIGLSIASVFAIAMTFTTNTATVKADNHTGGGYGMAGCGLGSIVISGKGSLAQILAATTNGTSGSQTFGITFGTSNCTDMGGGIVSVNAFIQTNREVIAKDISRGHGETIATLATLGGCQNSRAVGQKLQRNFSSIFPVSTVTDKQVSSNVVKLLQADKTLGCSKLI